MGHDTSIGEISELSRERIHSEKANRLAPDGIWKYGQGRVDMAFFSGLAIISLILFISSTTFFFHFGPSFSLLLDAASAGCWVRLVVSEDYGLTAHALAIRAHWPGNQQNQYKLLEGIRRSLYFLDWVF